MLDNSSFLSLLFYIHKLFICWYNHWIFNWRITIVTIAQIERYSFLVKISSNFRPHYNNDSSHHSYRHLSQQRNKVINSDRTNVPARGSRVSHCRGTRIIFTAARSINSMIGARDNIYEFTSLWWSASECKYVSQKRDWGNRSHFVVAVSRDRTPTFARTFHRV